MTLDMLTTVAKYLGGLILALVAITPGVLAYRSSRQADKRAEAREAAAAAEKLEADRQAAAADNKKASQADLEAAVEEWRGLYAEMKTELAAATAARREAEGGRQAAERLAREASAEVARLTDRVAHLEAENESMRDEIARLKS